MNMAIINSSKGALGVSLLPAFTALPGSAEVLKKFQEQFKFKDPVKIVVCQDNKTQEAIIAVLPDTKNETILQYGFTYKYNPNADNGAGGFKRVKYEPSPNSPNVDSIIYDIERFVHTDPKSALEKFAAAKTWLEWLGLASKWQLATAWATKIRAEKEKIVTSLESDFNFTVANILSAKS